MDGFCVARVWSLLRKPGQGRSPTCVTGAENAMTIGMQITGRLWGGNRYWLRLFDFVGRLMPK